MNKNLIFKLAKVDRKLALWLSRKAILQDVRAQRKVLYLPDNVVVNSASNYLFYRALKPRFYKNYAAADFLLDTCYWHRGPFKHTRWLKASLVLREVRAVGTRVLAVRQNEHVRGKRTSIVYGPDSFLSSMLSAQLIKQTSSREFRNEHGKHWAFRRVDELTELVKSLRNIQALLEDSKNGF